MYRYGPASLVKVKMLCNIITANWQIVTMLKYEKRIGFVWRLGVKLIMIHKLIIVDTDNEPINCEKGRRHLINVCVIYRKVLQVAWKSRYLVKWVCKHCTVDVFHDYWNIFKNKLSRLPIPQFYRSSYSYLYLMYFY